MIGSIVKVFIIALILSLSTTQTEAGTFIGDCYSTWSRCSTWSSWATGLLWATCEEKCMDIGYRGGKCVLVDGVRCSTDGTAYQCQCN